jgi:amidase
MTRTVADAAILLSVLTAVDRRDSATAQNDKKAVRDYTKFFQADGLRRRENRHRAAALGQKRGNG